MWLKIKQEGQTADFSPRFHLPGFYFGIGGLDFGPAARFQRKRGGVPASRFCAARLPPRSFSARRFGFVWRCEGASVFGCWCKKLCPAANRQKMLWRRRFAKCTHHSHDRMHSMHRSSLPQQLQSSFPPPAVRNQHVVFNKRP